MGGGIYESLPVGVVFRPNDEQMIDGYLIPKLWGENSRLKMEIPGNEAQVDIIPRLMIYANWSLGNYQLH